MMASRISQHQVRAAWSAIFKRHCQLRCSSAVVCHHQRCLGDNGDRQTSKRQLSYYGRPETGMCCTAVSRSLHISQRLNATHTIKMPSLSPTMTEGTIVKWLKKEGDPVSAGDVLCEIQTDKAVVSLDHDEDGILAKIIMPENSTDVKVGTLIALMVDEGDDWQNVEVPADAGAPPPSPAASESPSPASVISAPPPTTSSTGSHSSSHLLGPAVKNYLKQYGLDSGSISGSGPKGTVTKGDVLRHVQTKNIAPVVIGASAPDSAVGGRGSKSKMVKGKGPGASYKEVEISNMRKTIAKRLTQSKSTVPHAYGVQECNIKSLMEFRKKLASIGAKVSVNDLIIKSVGNALVRVPVVNSIWEGSQIKQQGQVDISVAVATPNGLITPIVWNVGNKDVVSIADAVRQLAAKAKIGKLQPQEFMGGTFSISNLGMFGIYSFSAIINPPQNAILAVGGSNTELGEDGKPISTVKVMLSYDARAIMEDEAIKFLAMLKNEIENVNEISMGIYSLDAKKEALDSDALT